MIRIPGNIIILKVDYISPQIRILGNIIAPYSSKIDIFYPRKV